MKNNNLINPVGLKGNQINERMKELMGIGSINESKSNIAVELTKMGPDGKAYAIVRENHEHYIKMTNKTSQIVAEDFEYIGGLQNKKQEAYPSYAKAIKQLNLRFNSLCETYNVSGEINVFEDDNLLSESGVAGFSQYGGNGFSNEGNLDNNAPLFEEEDADIDVTELDENEESKEEEEEEEVTLSEEMQAIEDMEKEESEEVNETINEHRLSISRAMDTMDSIIDSLNEGTLKKKVYTLK